MISYHLPELSSNSFEPSKIDDLIDTLIKVHDKTSGDVRVFNAHSNVICKRCEYFKIALSEKWAKKVDDKYKLRLDVSPDAFEIILE